MRTVAQQPAEGSVSPLFWIAVYQFSWIAVRQLSWIVAGESNPGAENLGGILRTTSSPRASRYQRQDFMSDLTEQPTETKPLNLAIESSTPETVPPRARVIRWTAPLALPEYLLEYNPVVEDRLPEASKA